MKKSRYNKFFEKDEAYIKEAKRAYTLFVFVFVLLIFLISFFKIEPYFISFIIVVTIMAVLYYYIFSEYIIYVLKLNEFKRIQLQKVYTVKEEVITYFSDEVFKNLYDDDFSILYKNDVYTLALFDIEGSTFNLGLAVCQMDSFNEEISPTTRELSNEISGYAIHSTIVKVVLLVKDIFSEEELEDLKYDSAVHKNTLVIGLEKSSNKLIYNYFLNGDFVDELLGGLFQVDLTKKK